jgi:hypothetical protein
MGSVLRERSIRSMPFHARLAPQAPLASDLQAVAHGEKANIEEDTETNDRASRQGSGENEIRA